MDVKQRCLLAPYLFILVGNTKFYGKKIVKMKDIKGFTMLEGKK
jgi:hypothetical protein